ncbi:MAG: protoporphyrinogen oxidase [candidate division Zixibacteria bacterium HGW-Zixibacteria-1]|nr:MAG: protoporphyrinogen oxidase [candidate division Zixibacteria bacterium HGW-Zixibacteria-1]
MTVKKRIAVIGGGISGLSALHFIKYRYADSCDVKLYEKESRLGGTIGTDRTDGFVSDWGPNGFLDKVPLTLRLVSELGLDELLDPAKPSAEKRFIYRNKKLHEIHASPPKFMRSQILTLAGRLRLVMEPLVPQKKDDSDESIFDFGKRRIGRDAAEHMIVPMVSGIYGGDARKLSLKACFPIMVEMEREYGSLFKALLARKKAGSKGGPAGPAGRLTSFKNGLYTLIETMHEKYRNHIVTGRGVKKISYADNIYTLEFESGGPENFDAVICAAPAYAATGMVSVMNEELSRVLASIPYSSIAVVCSGYKKEDVAHDLAGFGFLIPRDQNVRILGSIWTSSIFSGSAPDGMVQFRTMIGGATDPQAAALSDGELADIAHRELNDILGLSAQPGYLKIFKWSQGIPQFTIGHPERMEHLNKILDKYPGLQFAGNSYKGVSLNDCIVRSDEVVGAIAGQFNLQVEKKS